MRTTAKSCGVWTCGFLCLLMLASSRASADEKSKSPDGNVEITVADDGSVTGTNNKLGTQWKFPTEGVDKAKLYKTAFAAKDSKADTRYGSALYIAYGKALYCLNGKGELLWKIIGSDPGNAKVTLTFEGEEVVLTVGSTATRFDALTGKKSQ